MNNAQWLYDQCSAAGDGGPDDEGVHLTFAHAMQIAGELTRGFEAEGKLDRHRSLALELRKFFNAGQIDRNTDLYLLLCELEPK